MSTQKPKMPILESNSYVGILLRKFFDSRISFAAQRIALLVNGGSSKAKGVLAEAA